MESRASLVIVGAGIVGCAAAHYLSELGWRDVVVVDQGPLFQAGGSTSHAPGLVFQTNASKTMTNFARETVAHVWGSSSSMASHAGTASAVSKLLPRRRGGPICIASSAGPRVGEWKLRSCLRRRPKPNSICSTSRSSSARIAVPTDGAAKPVWAAEALARKATGATFHARTAVTGFEITRGQVRAVLTSNGRIETDRVLICCGIWGPRSGAVGRSADPVGAGGAPARLDDAIASTRGRNGGDRAADPAPPGQGSLLPATARPLRGGGYDHEPVVVDPDDIRPHGAPDDMPASNPFDAEAFAPSWQAAIELIPALAEVEIASAFNGMFSFTPDAFPLLGESDRVRGFWVAEAIWITHAAGVARAVAQVMTNGRADHDLRECDLNRFDRYFTTDAYVRERGAQQYREVYDVIHPLQPMERPRPLRRSPFFERQRELGAAFFESRGWEVARWYDANAPAGRPL